MSAEEMGNQFLNFNEEKVQVLTLDQLKQTHKENDVFGKPLKGMYHYEVIERCKEVAMDAGIRLVISEIFAAQNRDKMQPGVVLLPEVEKEYGERAVEAHILRRVFCNIRLEDYDTEEFTSNLAIAFHQEGIQVAFGNMVKVCHNQCIMGRDRLVQSYGKDKSENFEKMFEVVGEWMRESRNIIMEDRAKIERMKRTVLEPQQVLQVIGDLVTTRVAHDTPNKLIKVPGTYPLNATQINVFTEGLLVRQKQQDQITVWDIYDEATLLYKAQRMEIPNVLGQNVAMCEYLTENWI